MIHYRLKQFFFGNFTYLLVSLILLYSLRPYHRSLEYLRVWEFWLALVFFGAIFNCNHPAKIKVIAICLGVPALVFDWVSILHPHTVFIVLSFSFTAVFLLLCTLSLLYNEVLKAPVKLASIRPIICAYFMLAYAFSFLYLIEEHFHPGSIQFVTELRGDLLVSRELSSVIYFSFGNLTTAGSGNMTALTNTSQTITTLEVIVGQLYIAIVIARVIALYSHAQNKKRFL